MEGTRSGVLTLIFFFLLSEFWFLPPNFQLRTNLAFPSPVCAMEGTRSGILTLIFFLLLVEFLFLPPNFQLRRLKVSLLPEPGQHSPCSWKGLTWGCFSNINSQKGRKDRQEWLKELSKKNSAGNVSLQFGDAALAFSPPSEILFWPQWCSKAGKTAQSSS